MPRLTTAIPLEPYKPKLSCLDSLMAMQTTDTIMREVSDAKFVFKKLFVLSHICAVVAKPGAGKTAIVTYAAARMSRNGYQVLYVNVDASASDLKYYHQHATQHGYTLIAPDLHQGKSAKDVLTELRKLADSDEDLTGIVIVFDTLKKFTEVMNKSEGKKFYSLLRKLTARNLTTILLGHTNKYDDENGKPIYEGTADLKSDIDELIYLIPVKNEDGSMTVSTLIDKQRSVAEDATFHIAPDRTVTEAGTYVDTMDQHAERKQLSDDEAVILFIEECLASGCKSLSQIHETSKKMLAGFSRDRLQKVLTRYCGKDASFYKWDREAGVTSGFVYFLPKTHGGVKT